MRDVFFLNGVMVWGLNSQMFNTKAAKVFNKTHRMCLGSKDCNIILKTQKKRKIEFYYLTTVRISL